MDENRRGPITTPLSGRGIPPWATYLMAIVGMVYLLNPTAGILELLPDNLPLVGNLDEGVAMVLLWYGMIEFVEGRKRKR